MPSNKDFYDALTNLQLNAENVNLNVDQVETKLDTANGHLTTLSANTILLRDDVDDIRVDMANGVSISGTVPVSGTFWQATQPVSGTVTGLSDKGSVSEASTQSITTGGTHQQVFASNASRKFLLIQNISDTDMYVGLGFNPSNTTPAGLLLAKSGGGVVFESNYIPTSEVRIVCATSGKRFVALEG